MTDAVETLEGEVVESGTDLEGTTRFERQGMTVEVPGPVTLFRTDEPDLIIARATGVADALKRVLIEKQLISRIKDKEYVRVEGWTLLGTMLGVFPVCVWTRKLEDGWEARVEARTLTGATVGAAEAMCVRSEKTWAHRDEYALRSMAQTRATSKALRQPLDFVVRLAGFEATPAEEMPKDDPPRQAEAGKALMPRSWPDVEKSVKTVDNPEEAWALFEAFLRAATYHLYGKTSGKEIEAADRKVMLQKAAGACVWLIEHSEPEGPFTFYDETQTRKAWAHVLDGVVLEIPDYVPPEPPIPPEVAEEAERIAAEVFAEQAGEPS